MFAHPTSANIAGRDIESLSSALVGLKRVKAMGLMTVDGYKARIEYDAEPDCFRGEILGLNGGADFHGRNPRELRQEFRRSLAVFLEVCREKGIEPRRSYSGKFNLRIPPCCMRGCLWLRRPPTKASMPSPRRRWSCGSLTDVDVRSVRKSPDFAANGSRRHGRAASPALRTTESSRCDRGRRKNPR